MQGKNNAPAAESYVEFRDYEAALAYIDLLAGEHRRIVIAIDEYPYLAASYPTFHLWFRNI